MLTFDDIHRWPKADLHSHLDGAMRLETMLDLAKQQGKTSLLPSDSLDGLREALLRIDESTNLEEYLSWFSYTIGLMQDRASLARVAYEMAEDSAADNVRYLEVRFGPVLHTEDGLTLEQVLEAVIDGLSSAEADFGIRWGVIVCGLRDRFRSASMRQAEAAVAYRDRGVCAFDLAGGEAGNPPKAHLPAFYHARNHLLGLTVHAGESWGPESIRQALFYCGAHRIGHGITLWKDPELERFVADRRIPLEICPTSNVQTHVVDSFEDHPVGRLHAAGVPITINTDSLLFGRTTVTEELLRTHTRCGVDADAIRQMAVNGFRHAFLHWDERRELIAEAEREVSSK